MTNSINNIKIVHNGEGEDDFSIYKGRVIRCPENKTLLPAHARFCIHHEIGHAVDGRLRYSSKDHIQNWDMEYEADRYGKEKTSKKDAIGFLEFMQERYTYLPSMFHPTLSDRIFYLKTGVKLFNWERTKCINYPRS